MASAQYVLIDLSFMTSHTITAEHYSVRISFLYAGFECLADRFDHAQHQPEGKSRLE